MNDRADKYLGISPPLETRAGAEERIHREGRKAIGAELKRLDGWPNQLMRQRVQEITVALLCGERPDKDGG